MFKEVDPYEFTKVINKVDVVFFPPAESSVEPHTSENTSSKGYLDSLKDFE
jgi:hypothetical protein